MGVPVDRGVEVDVAPAFGLLLAPRDLAGVVAVLSMDAPSAALGDAADLLHIDVHHVPRSTGDLLRLPVGVAVGVDEPATVEAEGGEVARHCAPADRDADGMQLERDSGG